MRIPWARPAMAIVLGCGMSAAAVEASTLARVDLVAVLSQDLAPYRAAVEGLESEPGMRISTLDLGGDVAEGAWVLRQIRVIKPDVVVTVGSLATDVVGTRITEYPVVYCMTMETPDLARHAGMTGVSLAISPEAQLTVLKQAIRGLRSVGVIYDPEHSSELIALARAAAEAAGLKLVTRTVSDQGEVPDGLRDLIERADALWLVPDSTCFTRESFEFALKLTLERKIPTMVFAEAYVRAGALIALSPDYGRMGRQVARLVRRVLAGEPVSPAEPASPDAASLVINGRTARYLGVEIAPEILARAEKVFE